VYYAHEQIAEYFSEFEVRQFVIADDQTLLKVNPDIRMIGQQKYGCDYCWFIKTQ
jgi:hypothetical protein